MPFSSFDFAFLGNCVTILKEENNMAKIKNVTIVDAHTLRLDVDAKKNDEIDLNDLQTVDTTLLIQRINEQRDVEYQRRLEEFKKAQEENFVARLNEQGARKDQEISKLQGELTRQRLAIDHELRSIHQQEILVLEKKIVQIENELTHAQEKSEAQLSAALLKQKDGLSGQLNQLQLDLQNKENQLVTLEKEYRLRATLDLQKQETEYKEEILNLNNKIANLQRDKSSLNIKKMGENLEKWCDNEYQQYAQIGFFNCRWSKDNTVIKSEGETKGSKADYLFEVFDNEAHAHLLTKVVCEMKSEDEESIHKKKNEDHYKKLDTDRQKKGAKYALLISELEWDSANDVPIRKVRDYEDMYLVRPPYFMTFLSIINTLTNQYGAILQQKMVELESFQDQQEIIDEFEKMKKDLFEKPIIKLESKLGEIAGKSEKIKTLAEDINDMATILLTDELNKIMKRIADYRIQKISKKVAKLSE